MGWHPGALRPSPDSLQSFLRIAGWWDTFADFPRFEYRCWLWNDSTSVKAHLQKWEPNSENNQFIGTSRGEKTTKICAVVDMPLVIRCILFLQRTGSWRLCRNPFDEGSIHMRMKYSWRQSTWFLQNSGIHHFQRSNLYNSAHGELRRAVILWFYTYKERHLVECFFNKLKAFRRVATRYDKLATSFIVFVHLASIWLLVK